MRTFLDLIFNDKLILLGSEPDFYESQWFYNISCSFYLTSLILSDLLLLTGRRRVPRVEFWNINTTTLHLNCPVLHQGIYSCLNLWVLSMLNMQIQQQVPPLIPNNFNSQTKPPKHFTIPNAGDSIFDSSIFYVLLRFEIMSRNYGTTFSWSVASCSQWSRLLITFVAFCIQTIFYSAPRRSKQIEIPTLPRELAPCFCCPKVWLRRLVERLWIRQARYPQYGSWLRWHCPRLR